MTRLRPASKTTRRAARRWGASRAEKNAECFFFLRKTENHFFDHSKSDCVAPVLFCFSSPPSPCGCACAFWLPKEKKKRAARRGEGKKRGHLSPHPCAPSPPPQINVSHLHQSIPLREAGGRKGVNQSGKSSIFFHRPFFLCFLFSLSLSRCDSDLLGGKSSPSFESNISLSFSNFVVVAGLSVVGLQNRAWRAKPRCSLFQKKGKKVKVVVVVEVEKKRSKKKEQ